MSEAEFEAAIEEHDKLAFYQPARNGHFFVQNWKDDRFDVADLSVAWLELESFLKGERPAIIMEHMSRVCGYYSRIDNWNASKLAELADRQKGDYEVH